MIWTITGIRREMEKTLDYNPTYYRTFGFKMSEQEAVDCVLQNFGCLSEAGYYKWFVVEPVLPHLHPLPPTRLEHPHRIQIWFVENEEQNSFVELKEQPREIKDYLKHNMFPVDYWFYEIG